MGSRFLFPGDICVQVCQPVMYAFTLVGFANASSMLSLLLLFTPSLSAFLASAVLYSNTRKIDVVYSQPASVITKGKHIALLLHLFKCNPGDLSNLTTSKNKKFTRINLILLLLIGIC